jgi:hypothetical protein
MKSIFSFKHILGTKSWRMRWAKHVACMEDMINLKITLRGHMGNGRAGSNVP